MTFDPTAVQIIIYPDPRLRRVCKPVEIFDEDLDRLTLRMLKLMHEAKGIGLAAPQVGVLRRFFVCNVTGDPADDRIYVNPELSDFEGFAEGEEGCLSIPDVTVTVRRSLSCTMRACDAAGAAIETHESELLARVWQHECDHLTGRLILDYMSEADTIANRRVLKQLEEKVKPRRSASR